MRHQHLIKRTVVVVAGFALLMQAASTASLDRFRHSQVADEQIAVLTGGCYWTNLKACPPDEGPCRHRICTYNGNFYTCPRLNLFLQLRTDTMFCEGGAPVGHDGCSPPVPKRCGGDVTCLSVCPAPPPGATTVCATNPNAPPTNLVDHDENFDDGADCPPQG